MKMFRLACAALPLLLFASAATAQEPRRTELPPGMRLPTAEEFREIQEIELLKRQIRKLDEDIATQKAIREAEQAKAAQAASEPRKAIPAPVIEAKEAPLLIGALLILATLGGTVLGFVLGRLSRKRPTVA